VSFQSFQVKSNVLVRRKERIEGLLLDQMVGQTPEPIAGMRREGDLLFAEVEEDVGGRHPEQHALDVEHAWVASLEEIRHSR